MTPRKFVRKKKIVQVDEHDEWVAVRGVEPMEKGPTPPAFIGTPELIKAGWRFLRPQDVSPLLKAEKAKVFVTKGRILLAPGRVVAKFEPSQTSEEIDQLLAPLDLRVVGKLSFAPNLFEIEPRGTELRDALEVAEALGRIRSCEFAEPIFLEFLGGREVAA